MSPEEFEVKDGISRRRMLKRIGAGAAVAWSAPILTSIKTPAFAQYDSEACDPDSTCDPSTPCNVLDLCGGDRGDCACFVRIRDNACACDAFPSNFCADYPPCNSDADCPSGQECYASCCPSGICRGPCGSFQGQPRMRGTGARVTR